MSKTKDAIVTVTVDFDNMPDHIGNFKDGKRFLNPEDMPKILGYMSDRIGNNTDVVALCGYLPAFGWIQVGAALQEYPPMEVHYLAQNGFSCALPGVTGYE